MWQRRWLTERLERNVHAPVVLRRLPVAPISMPTLATAGSLSTMRPSSNCFRDISANEMSWAASEVPMIKPVSWSEEALGNDIEKIAGESDRQQEHDGTRAEIVMLERPSVETSPIDRPCISLEHTFRDPIRTFRVGSGDFGLEKRTAITGISVSDDHSRDAQSSTVTVTANSRNMRPTSLPPMSTRWDEDRDQ